MNEIQKNYLDHSDNDNESKLLELIQQQFDSIVEKTDGVIESMAEFFAYLYFHLLLSIDQCDKYFSLDFEKLTDNEKEFDNFLIELHAEFLNTNKNLAKARLSANRCERIVEEIYQMI
jgi:hypothetical protein